jgi:hypothetical protein
LERILKDKPVLPTFTPNPQAQQQHGQQQTEKQAETQSPAPGTPFRRLGPLARGTQLSQLGGSSPMNLFSFVDQLANAMTDDLAGESSLYHTNLSIQSNLSFHLPLHLHLHLHLQHCASPNAAFPHSTHPQR